MLSQASLARVWGPACTGQRATISLHGAGKVTVRAEAIEATKALNQILIKYNYKTRAADTGAYVCRKKVSGNGWSNHSYATAIDINWLSNPYGSRLVTNMPSGMPREICQIKTNNGKQVWNWGGYWRGNKDAMHYEIVCSPADLRTGINWGTVGGGIAPPPHVPKPPAKPEPEKKEEDEEMETLILHHDGSWWLYRGSIRTPVTKADHLARWNGWLAPQGRVRDLRNDKQLSDMFFESSLDVSVINKTFLHSVQSHGWIGKLLDHFKIKK